MSDAFPDEDARTPAGGELIYRHRIATRIWHGLNALAFAIMLMSGLMIFNAHPRLYWGKFGANTDAAWLEIGSTADSGFLRFGPVTIPTTGVLGRWTDHQGNVQNRAFPGWATVPGRYDLAGARQWHFAFAWLLVVPGLLYWLWGFVSRHVQRDLAPSRRELAPRHIWYDITEHAKLRFPTGAKARDYNILQKLSYLIVLFVLLPLAVLTGFTLSPGLDAAWPWLLDLFGGRASARSLHFIAAMGLLGFFVVHVTMVALAGPFNEVRSMITGRYRLPLDRAEPEPDPQAAE